jgi:hypothetical protein
MGNKGLKLQRKIFYVEYLLHEEFFLAGAIPPLKISKFLCQ